MHAEEPEEEVQPLTKRQRKRAKQLEEDRIREAEQRQLAQPSPQSVLDHERLVRPKGDAILRLEKDLVCEGHGMHWRSTAAPAAAADTAAFLGL